MSKTAREYLSEGGIENVHDLDLVIVTDIIRALLGMVHDFDEDDLDQDENPLAWRNGNTPHERALCAIKEAFNVDWKPAWGADGGLKSLRVWYRDGDPRTSNISPVIKTYDKRGEL